MSGYCNPRLVELENDCLRRRLATIKAETEAFIKLVSRYVEPKKGDAYCSRNELLLAREHLKTLLK